MSMDIDVGFLKEQASPELYRLPDVFSGNAEDLCTTLPVDAPRLVLRRCDGGYAVFRYLTEEADDGEIVESKQPTLVARASNYDEAIDFMTAHEKLPLIIKAMGEAYIHALPEELVADDFRLNAELDTHYSELVESGMEQLRRRGLKTRHVLQAQMN